MYVCDSLCSVLVLSFIFFPNTHISHTQTRTNSFHSFLLFILTTLWMNGWIELKCVCVSGCLSSIYFQCKHTYSCHIQTTPTAPGSWFDHHHHHHNNNIERRRWWWRGQTHKKTQLNKLSSLCVCVCVKITNNKSEKKMPYPSWKYQKKIEKI